VADPRGLSDPLSVAEKLATFVAGLVMTPGTGVAVAVGVGVWVGVGVGVGVGGACAQYLPPVFTGPPVVRPPQTIIWLPVQTAV
jgi:hypothetical protein